MKFRLRAEASVAQKLADDGWAVHTDGLPKLATRGDDLLIYWVVSKDRVLPKAERELFEIIQRVLPERYSKILTSPDHGINYNPERGEIVSEGRRETSIILLGKYLYVDAPYQTKFVEGARELGGIFKRHLRVWQFRYSRLSRLKTLFRRCYGDLTEIKGDK